jgi:hypothetical protein
VLNYEALLLLEDCVEDTVQAQATLIRVLAVYDLPCLPQQIRPQWQASAATYTGTQNKCNLLIKDFRHKLFRLCDRHLAVRVLFEIEGQQIIWTRIHF